MRAYIPLFILTSLLLGGCQVENTQTLTQDINHSLETASTYSQTTQIDQKATDTAHPQTSQQTNTVSVTNNQLKSGKVIVKQTNTKDQYLEMKQDDNGNTYIKEDNTNWEKTSQNNAALSDAFIISNNQVLQLFNFIAENGEWQQYPTKKTLTFSGASEELLTLLNHVANIQINPGATHEITLTINGETPIDTIQWQVTGNSRTDNQSIDTTIDIQYHS